MSRTRLVGLYRANRDSIQFFTDTINNLLIVLKLDIGRLLVGRSRRDHVVLIIVRSVPSEICLETIHAGMPC